MRAERPFCSSGTDLIYPNQSLMDPVLGYSFKGLGTSPPQELADRVNGIGLTTTRYHTQMVMEAWETLRNTQKCVSGLPKRVGTPQQ